MATGASTAELAIVLIDARSGVLQQTRRHSFILSLLGVRHVVVAINKMDLVEFDKTVFDSIEREYRQFADKLSFESIVCIPMSALHGDNITEKSNRTPWFKGSALLPYLETVDVSADTSERPFRLPVQWVNRPNLDFRGYSGTVASGRVSVGDEVVVLPSAKRTTVADIVTHDGSLPSAGPAQAVTLTLADEIDISRGDLICAGQDPAQQTDQFAAHLIWMGEEELLPRPPISTKDGE